MQIRDDNKTKILLTMLRERYEASHKMRARSQGFAIWILGYGIAISWMLLGGETLVLPQKVIFTAFVLVIGMLSASFLKSIEAGFDRNREVMISIEEALGFYDEGVYLENAPLLPPEYRDLSRKGTFHFPSLYRWLIAEEAILICLIWHDSILQVAMNIKEALHG